MVSIAEKFKFSEHTALITSNQKILNETVKGQIISECLFDVCKFSKKPTKNLTNFCPRI